MSFAFNRACIICVCKGSSSAPVSTSPPFLGEESSSLSPNSRGLFLNSSSGGNTLPPSSSSLIFTSASTSGIYSANKTKNIRRGPGRPRKEFLPGQKELRENHRVAKRVRGGGTVRGGFYAKRKLVPPWPASSLTFGIQNQTQDNNYISNMMLPSSINDDGSNSLTPGTPVDQDTVNGNFNNVSGDKVMQPPEEPPYFPEKWPGKVCALCCLGERSQLGQGEMLRMEVKNGDSKVTSQNSSQELSQATQGEDKSPRSLSGPQLSNRRQKGLNKCK